MSSNFDPYHKWFGIPAAEQPPNHYRLLRIALFESDAEVIENAYNKEMADLKAEEHGQYVELVEKLSRELVEAHTCLLDAGKKAEYDATLRRKLGVEEERDELAQELAQRMAIDQAVQQATANLIARRNQLRAQVQQASLREKQALLYLQQMQQQWAVAARTANTLTPSFAQSQYPLQSQYPVQKKRKWVLPVVIAGSATAVILLVMGFVIAVYALRNTRELNGGSDTATVGSEPSGGGTTREPVRATNFPPNVGTTAGQERDDNGLKMKFCWCPSGAFTMGSPTDESGRRKGHEDQVAVTLASGFWLGKHEVTQEQWVQVMGTKPWRNETFVMQGADYPATYVNWDDAMEFCSKLTEQERRAGRLPADWQYTLPTEAQWEYACRASTSTRFSFGDDESQLGEFAWFDKNAGDVQERYPHQVGVKKSNEWGLHDMHGNAGEWCRDSYMAKLPSGTNPELTSVGSDLVFRGGSWYNSAVGCRSAHRFWGKPVLRFNALGFRVAAVPSSK